MVVLDHEHSLSLIDLNPKYPRYEEVYDDEEDLISKQTFRCLCNRCNQQITYVHRYYYKCDQCDYSLHKLCEGLPKKLEHASHSEHTLTLVLDESLGRCYMCQRIPKYRKLCYRCSTCMFSICLDCGMDRVQYHTIYHPGHRHPLIPICRQRQISAECDACGKEHNGVFYECPTCLRFAINHDCAFQPQRLFIQDDTCRRFFHVHTLTITYFCPQIYWKARFNPNCRVCDNSFLDNENIWVYKCEKCRYYVHVDCAVLRDGGPSKSERNNEDSNILKLPLANETYNKMTDFLFKENNEMSITHISHEHSLTLVGSDITTLMNKVEDICNACVEPILERPFYKCTSKDPECNFALHEWCTQLPNMLKGHEGYPQHTLLLEPFHPYGIFQCRTCLVPCNGFLYTCIECKAFHVDVICAFTRKKIRHKFHPHHNLFITNYRRGKDYCRMCLIGFIADMETSLSCSKCQFHLHPRCALLLPETVRHKYDKHPMILSCGPVENHDGDYFCEVCEEELNPNGSFYHCAECVQSMHTTCAPLIPQTQSKPHIFCIKGVSKHFNIKFGGLQKVKDHEHPMLISVRPWYGDSHMVDVGFKCLQCSVSFSKLAYGMGSELRCGINGYC